jgi:hypothetical protein
MLTTFLLALIIAMIFELAITITLLRRDSKSLTNMVENLDEIHGCMLAIAEDFKNLSDEMTRVD